MNDTTVLITGATGLVGRAFARRAAEDGYKVQAMVRAGSDRSSLNGIPVEFVEGDLARPETLPDAVSGADIVVHAAAHVGDWGPPELYRAINVMALEHMLIAAERQGRLKRWIQISSLGVYPARHHFGTDETTPTSLSGLDGYTQTKAEAEEVIKRHIRDHGLPAVILRPGFIYGPGDRHALKRIVERIENGTLRFVGAGDKVLNNTSVDNLVDAIMLAMQNPDALGEIFNIRDERLVTREEFINTVADYLGRPAPGHAPEWLARSIVGPVEGIAKLLGKTTPPFLTKAQLKFMANNLDFSINKAKRVLGYQPRVDFREGIIPALDYTTGKSSEAISEPATA